MKYVLISLLVIVAAFGYVTANFDLPATATAPATVAASDKGGDEPAPASAPATKKRREADYHLPAYITDRPEKILAHSAMTISWNSRLHLPNYVAWTLTQERIDGTVTRLDDFQPDPLLGDDSPVTNDYRGSGYDRGHICPAADNKHSKQAQKECFYMTNMCPQTHTLNAGDWNQIEDLCRRWTRQYGTLYIAGGPIVGEPHATLPSTQIAIPDAFFKVVMRRGEYGAKAIGFVCPNGTQNLNPRDYAVTVDSVEALTGINFFSRLPKAEERKAEASFDAKDWKGL